MKYLLAVPALVLFNIGCATGQQGVAPSPPAIEDTFFEEPYETERPSPPKAEEPATDTTSGTSRHEPPPPPPEPEPQAPLLPAEDGVPSIETQIQQCTEQTGLPDECRSKIQDGIVE